MTSISLRWFSTLFFLDWWVCYSKPCIRFSTLKFIFHCLWNNIHQIFVHFFLTQVVNKTASSLLSELCWRPPVLMVNSPKKPFYYTEWSLPNIDIVNFHFHFSDLPRVSCFQDPYYAMIGDSVTMVAQVDGNPPARINSVSSPVGTKVTMGVSILVKFHFKFKGWWQIVHIKRMHPARSYYINSPDITFSVISKPWI